MKQVQNQNWQMASAFGSYNINAKNALQSTGGLTSFETYSIDIKIDDGIPVTGKMLGIGHNVYSAGQCTTNSWNGLPDYSTITYVIPDPNNYKLCRIWYLVD